MNKFMKFAIAAVIAVVVIVGGAYMILSKQSSHAKVIPTNAVAVLKVDAKSLAMKSNYKKFSKDKDLEKLLEMVPEDVRKKLDEIIKKPTSTGVNFLGDLYTFAVPPKKIEDMDNALIGFSAPLLSKKKFEKTLLDIAKSMGDESGELFQKEKGISFIEATPQVAIGWNKKAFVILSAPECKEDGYVLNTLKERLKAKKKESILANKNFKKFISKKNDISLWATSNIATDLFKNEMVAAIAEYSDEISEFKKSLGEKDLDVMELVPDNYMHIAVNFQKGAIKATANFDTNKKLTKLMKKYSTPQYKNNTNLWASLPGKDPLFALSAQMDAGKYKKNVKKQLKNLADNEDIATGIKMFEEQLGMSLEEALFSFTGNFAAVVTGVDLNGYTPMPTVTMALSMKNDKLYEKVTKLAETAGAIKEDGDCFAAEIPAAGVTVYTSCKKNVLKFSNVKENASTENFKKNSLKANKELKSLAKSTGMAYLNLDIETLPANIVDMIKAEAGKDQYDMIKKYAITKSLSIASTKKNALEVTLNLKDKKKNSLEVLANTTKEATKDYLTIAGGGLF